VSLTYTYASAPDYPGVAITRMFAVVPDDQDKDLVTLYGFLARGPIAIRSIKLAPQNGRLV